MNVYRKLQSIFCYVVDVNIISICLLSVILITSTSRGFSATAQLPAIHSLGAVCHLKIWRCWRIIEF